MSTVTIQYHSIIHDDYQVRNLNLSSKYFTKWQYNNHMATLSVGLKIYATGRYALWVVLGTACFSQSLVGRLTWSE